MASGAPKGALRTIAGQRKGAAAGEADGFNADDRTQTREQSPVTIAGRIFRRRRKDWSVSRLMRGQMRDQEKSVALANRLRARIAELEVEQITAATEGNDERELELEGQIEALVERADEATEVAELVTYRLLALLLIPDAGGDDDAELRGWGPDEADASDDAIAYLQPALDVEDAADLARELTGSREPDPPETPSSETGSS